MLVCSGAANGRVKDVFQIWLSITCFKISASLLEIFFSCGCHSSLTLQNFGRDLKGGRT